MARYKDKEKPKLICEGAFPDWKCGKPATWIVALATRAVARCDKHSQDQYFISIVLGRKPIYPKRAMKHIIPR